MTVREFLTILRRRWKTVLAAVLLAVAASALITLRTPAVYTATARVYLSAQAARPSSGSTQDRGTVVLTSGDLSTYVSILISPDVTVPLRKTLGLSDSTPLGVSGQALTTGPLLDLTAQAGNAQLAADAANALGPQLALSAAQFSPLLETTGQRVVSTAVSPAGVPGAPTTPRANLNIAVGLLAGLLLGIGLALIRNFLDTRIRVDSDIRELSDKPILTHIPLDKGGKTRTVAMRSDPHGTTAEAIRRLRTNLLFVDVTTGRHSFVVTSAMAGEGKTSTAVNLAVAMASSGTKALLVDGDLRNPSVARTLRIDGDIGLTTLLLGQVDIDVAVQCWGDTTLDVLPAGPIPPNPSELLGSVPMELLFHELKARYDFVIIDSPPLVPVVDAILLDRLAGGLLMVAASDRTKKRDLATALRALETASTSVSGFALNFVTGEAARNYAYGYYRSNTSAVEAALPADGTVSRSGRH